MPEHEHSPIVPDHIGEIESDIAFTDSKGDIPLDGRQLRGTIPDFDSDLTQAIRPGAPWPHIERYGIGFWPDVASYGIALTDQLRRGQEEQATLMAAYRDRRGIDRPLRREEAIASSLGNLVVVQGNHNPRNRNNSERKVNGSPWYVGMAGDNLAIVSQLPYFEQIERFGGLTFLGRVNSDVATEFYGNPKEQFTSSVSPAFAELVRGDFDEILFDYRDRAERKAAETSGNHPEIFSEELVPARIAYFDRYLNTRLLVANQLEVVKAIEAGAGFKVFIDGEPINEPVNSGSSLFESELDVLTLYKNPADPEVVDGPGYIEFARRVVNPNDVSYSAVATIVKHVEAHTGEDFRSQDLGGLELELEAA